MATPTTSRLLLLTGGARAGKSAFALRLVSECRTTSNPPVCVIATAQALDDEMSQRIAQHRAERPDHWQTIEEPYQIDDALQQTSAGVVLLDCLTMFVSNWLLRVEDEHRCEQIVRQITRDFLDHVQSRSGTVICVSNEVGLGIVPETRLGRMFRDVLGRVNQDFAAAADEVHMLVAGLSLQLKP